MSKKAIIICSLAFVLVIQVGAIVSAKELANVNGISISTELFERRMQVLTRERQGDFSGLEIKEELLDGLITEEILDQEGRRLKLDKSKNVMDRVNELTTQLVIREFVNNIVRNKITPETMQVFYKKVQGDFRQVHAKHILVKTEEEAKAARKKLDEGADFSTLAKEISKDQGSAAKGGDLGFFMEIQMVKPFSEAAFSMKKNEISDPVKSNFGYHIIQVLDMRTPDFDTLSAQQQQKLRSDMINSEIEALKKKATITINKEALKEVGPPPHEHAPGEEAHSDGPAGH